MESQPEDAVNVEQMRTSSKPVLLAVDNDVQALATIEHELVGRYASGYRVVCEASAEAGLRTLARCKASGEDVALLLADQWMPEMTGADFLGRARRAFPTARRALLVAWGPGAIRTPARRSFGR